MKLSMGKTLKGKVVEIKKGMIMTRVTVDLGGGAIITAIVTAAALQALDVRVGAELEVTKDTGIMADGYLH
jgi:molybdopterin-binding protein